MKSPRSPYAPRRSQYVAAGIVAVVGLAVAALIAVLAIRASGNVPAAPGSYMIKSALQAEPAP